MKTAKLFLNASCTTNCVVSVAVIPHLEIGIEKATLTDYSRFY